MTDPVEAYLQDLYHIRSSGAATKETSYYPVLERLLNEIGKQLKPSVNCIMNIASRVAELPDGVFLPVTNSTKELNREHCLLNSHRAALSK